MRFGFGRFTTENDVDALIESLTKAIERMRRNSPLWEMKKQGIDINTIHWDED